MIFFSFYCQNIVITVLKQLHRFTAYGRGGVVKCLQLYSVNTACTAVCTCRPVCAPLSVYLNWNTHYQQHHLWLLLPCLSDWVPMGKNCYLQGVCLCVWLLCMLFMFSRTEEVKNEWERVWLGVCIWLSECCGCGGFIVPLLMFDPCHLTQEEAAWAQVSLGSAALREARAELAEARKQWHSLQVEIETLHALVRKHTSSRITTANSP